MLAIGYLFFSSIETFAYFILLLCIFRFNPKLYIMESATVSLVVSFLSYFLREEMGIKSFFPIIALFVFIFFTKIVLKASFIWSIIISVISYFIFFLIQTGLLLLLTITGIISLDVAQNASIDQFVGQLITAILLIVPSYFLFNKGFGYSREFDTLKFKGETILSIFIGAGSMLLLGYFFLNKNLIHAFLTLCILAIVFIVFYLRKRVLNDT